MSEIRDRVIEKLAELEHIQWQHYAKVRNPEHLLVDVPYSELTEEQKEQDRVWVRKVLELSELAIVDREAELPKRPEKIIWEQYHKDIYNRAQQDMLKAGYVKEVKDEDN